MSEQITFRSLTSEMLTYQMHWGKEIIKVSYRLIFSTITYKAKKASENMYHKVLGF